MSLPLNKMATTTTASHAPNSNPQDNDVLLEVSGLKMHFPISEGLIFQKAVSVVKAVDGVSFNIRKGETLGLVGESGCGKTTTGRCILQLEKATEGQILFEGQDLTQLNSKALIPLRQKIQVIFQDPYSSLNPRLKIGDTISEPMKVHGVEPDASQRRKRVTELLNICGLPAKMADRYPHEMSGGQRQRVALPVPCRCVRSSSFATKRFRHWTFRFRPRSSTCWRICARSSN